VIAVRAAAFVGLFAALLLSGCDRRSASSDPGPQKAPGPAQDSAPVARDAPTTSPAPAGAADVGLILREWRRAENRGRCAPLAFSSLGGSTGTARRANFAGGWAVAYDLPGQRSAFGLAGPGLIEADEDPVPDQRARLARQWPLFRDLAQLPTPAFAGYGIEGGGAYPADNPDGHGYNSLAYVRVGGQTCTYNVWSRLGRAHLEHLLENLAPVEP
jgi:hypothetical protein